MAFYKGKNSETSTIRTMFERSKYRTEVIAPSEKSMKDFTFVEYNNYGRIDSTLDTVYNTRTDHKLITSHNSDSPLEAINFVVDAFNNIKTQIIKAKSIGVLPKNLGFISDLDPKKAFSDPFPLYESYITRMFEHYNELFLKDFKVRNFDDYYKYFLDFSRTMGYNYPMTFTGWQRSKRSNIFTSGLAISIADLPSDQDELKEKFFINNTSFEFYKNLCMNNGFVISKNVPWILVAEILSPSLILYSEKYYLSSKNSIFFKHFEKTFKRDIELLINYILINYFKYININPYYKELYICNNITKERIIYRDSINLDRMKEKYTQERILPMYSKIRNIEEYSVINDVELNNHIKYSIFLTKSLDKQKGMSYINNVFRKTYITKQGGYNDLVNRLNEKDKLINGG